MKEEINGAMKEILIGKMLDTPEQLTPEEINEITQDQELRELYEVSVQMRNSLMKPVKTDKSTQWRRLVKRLLKLDKWTFKNIFRAAAIIIGVIFLDEATSHDNNNLDFNF